MFRRVLLAVSFVAALGVAGFMATESAEAHGCGRGYGGYRGGYGAYYGGGYGGYYPGVVRTSYYPPVYYGAPVYYGGYGGGCHHGHCHYPGGVSFSVGF